MAILTQSGKACLEKRLCLLIFGLCVCFINSNAAKITETSTLEVRETHQAKVTVKGTVTDTDGEPLVGVSVGVKGTALGVMTNMEGNYMLEVPAGSILSFTYIGYTSKTVKVEQSKILDIVLETNIRQLDEVEIVAEFGMKRVPRAIGSSVQNVKAADIIESGRDNFISALQGRVSGIDVVSSSGLPGASNTITLRSLTSISGSNQPLYVVDGIPMNNSTFNSASGFAVEDVYAGRNLDFSSRGNDFNPEDIESMTILKGAAAAALYGSNASNGAIIITTKKGTVGKGKVSYSNAFRWEKAYGYPKVQNKYAQGRYGATDYLNRSKYGGLYPDDTQFYDNVAAILQTGFTSKHNISVEAGTEKQTLRATASFIDQKGVMKTTAYTRTNLSLSGKAQIKKWMRFEGSMQYASTTNHKVRKGSSGALAYAMLWPIIDDMRNYLDPIDKSHMRQPDRYADGDYLNPLFMLYKNKYYDESDRIIGNAVAIISPTANTFFRVQLGFDSGTATYETSEHPYWRTYNYDLAPGVGGVYNLAKSNYSDPTINILAGWNDSFLDDKITVNVQAGYHQLENKVSTLSTYGENYAVLELASINNCDPTTIRSRKIMTRRRIQAISAQVETGYDNMAFLTFRARNDWSSTLPVANRSYFYPALEGSLILTELLSFKSKAITYLKLRGAVAQVGKDAGPLEINPVLQPSERSGGGYNYGWTGPNPDLKPEMTTSWEIGAEGRFFNDRIVADFTYFRTRCNDQIVKGFRMSYVGGFVLNTRNMGDFKTWGWEAHIDGDIINRNGMRLNVGLNLSHTGSKLVSMPTPEYYDAYTWNSGDIRSASMVGEPLTIVQGKDFERNDNGDVLINPASGLPIISNKYVVLGDRQPELRYGIPMSFSYKGFRFSAMFAGMINATVVNGTKRQMLSQGSSWESVALREQGPVVFDGVLKDGNENTDHPTINTISYTYGLSSSIYLGADADWIENNVKYLRLQELRLSYTLPSKFLKNLWGGLISHANVYISGNDLYVWTNYSGIDAVGNTVSASAGGAGGAGYDTWAIPSPRGISCGVSLTF